MMRSAGKKRTSEEMLDQNASPQEVNNCLAKRRRMTKDCEDIGGAEGEQKAVVVLPSQDRSVGNIPCSGVDFVIFIIDKPDVFENWTKGRRRPSWVCAGHRHPNFVVGPPQAFSGSQKIRQLAADARASRRGYRISPRASSQELDHCQQHMDHIQTKGLYDCCLLAKAKCLDTVCAAIQQSAFEVDTDVIEQWKQSVYSTPDTEL